MIIFIISSRDPRKKENDPHGVATPGGKPLNERVAMFQNRMSTLSIRYIKSGKLRQTNCNEFIDNFVMKKAGQNLFNCLLCYVQRYLIRWLQLFVPSYVFQ